MVDDLFWDGLRSVNKEKGTAQSVQSFNFSPPLFGFERSALCARGKLACGKGRSQKRERATQFCGSLIVNVLIGGRKKKLKHNIAARDATVDSTNPPLVAMKQDDYQIKKAGSDRVYRHMPEEHEGRCAYECNRCADTENQS